MFLHTFEFFQFSREKYPQHRLYIVESSLKKKKNEFVLKWDHVNRYTIFLYEVILV